MSIILFWLINVQMPTIILTFNSRINASSKCLKGRNKIFFNVYFYEMLILSYSVELCMNVINFYFNEHIIYPTQKC